MKKMIGVLTAALCCLTMTLPVAAEPPSTEGTEQKPILRDVTTEVEGNICRITKLYDTPPDYPSALLAEDDFEKNGIVYRVGDMIQLRENHKEEKKLAAQTVSLSHETKEVPLLSPLLNYSMDGFSGQLQLDMDSVSTVSTSEQSYSYTISDTREFAGLARNDTYSIPKSVTKNGVRLTLSDVQWTNLGDSYTALAVYTGTAYGKKATGYTTTAVYTGEVFRDTLESVTWKVVYEGVSQAETQTDMQVKDNRLLLGGAALAVLLIGGGLVTIFVIRRRKQHFGGDEDEEEEDEEEN